MLTTFPHYITVTTTEHNVTQAFNLAMVEVEKHLSGMEPGTNYYTWKLVLVKTTFEYYDFGNRNSYSYRFKLKE